MADASIDRSVVVGDLGGARRHEMRRDDHQRIGAERFGGAAVLQRQIGSRRAGIDDHRHAAADVIDDGPGDQVALGFAELEDLRTERDAEAVDAGGDVEIDEALQAVDVDPSLFVERRDEDRDDALQ